MRSMLWLKRMVLVFAFVSMFSVGNTLKAQDNASDTADIGSGTSEIERGVDAIDDAAEQRDAKEDFYGDPANAPIPE